ncbi:dockerin type I domain-containing protein, partial [Desulfobacterales bacterium HSG17]|nr:dockerin type I domain-containing protein [Desulfobacterales bacterium HSG17]
GVYKKLLNQRIYLMKYFKKPVNIHEHVKTIFLLLFIIFLLTGNGVSQEINRVYWTDLAENSRPWRIILKPNENHVIRLKAEVPPEKFLKAYSFTLTYDPSIISIISIEKSSDSEFPPMNINNSTPGSIIFNAFNTNGLKGGIVVSLIDVSIRAKLSGVFDFNITVNSFGSDSTDQFKPEPDILSVFVSNDDVSIIPGDVNHDGSVNLTDEILAAQIMSGIIPERTIYKQADVNHDLKIGIQEMIYILNNISEPEHIQGDINKDSRVDLKDAVLVLQILCNIDTNQTVFKEADINKDGKIGIQEAVFILVQISNIIHTK